MNDRLSQTHSPASSDRHTWARGGGRLIPYDGIFYDPPKFVLPNNVLFYFILFLPPPFVKNRAHVWQSLFLLEFCFCSILKRGDRRTWAEIVNTTGHDCGSTSWKISVTFNIYIYRSFCFWFKYRSFSIS